MSQDGGKVRVPLNAYYEFDLVTTDSAEVAAGKTPSLQAMNGHIVVNTQAGVTILDYPSEALDPPTPSNIALGSGSAASTGPGDRPARGQSV